MSCNISSFRFRHVFLLIVACANMAVVSLAIDEVNIPIEEISAEGQRSRRHNGGAKGTKKGGKKVAGAYIVELAGDTPSFQVELIAKKHASEMSEQVQNSIASGELSVLNNTHVAPGRIFTSSIKGFTLTGVPDILAHSLVDMSGVISFEQDETVSLDDGDLLLDLIPLEYHQDGKTLLPLDKTQRGGLLQTDTPGNSSCPQMISWGIKRVGGPLVTNPNPNGKVFVIDTGIFPVTDLVIDETLSQDFIDDGSSPPWSDGNGHGTHVAGTIAAIDNCVDVVGVVPGATVVAIRVLDSTGSGYNSDVIAGIDYVAANGKQGDVANLSLAVVSQDYSMRQW